MMDHLDSTTVSFALLVLAIIAIVKYFNQTDIPKIPGMPEPRGLPIVGNLHQLKDNHALHLYKMSQDPKLGPVFQVRMGNKRIVVANSFASVRELWITNQSALISRPMLYTFHSVVSSSQGFTIGTSPWDASCKARRKATATALNRPAVRSYMPIVNLESYACIRDLYRDSRTELNPKIYLQRFALNTSLCLNYGFRCEGDVNNELLREIIEVENAISRFRSTSNNWADYIPLLQMLPSSSALPQEYRVRRDKYLARLISDLKARIAEGTDIPCITGNILKDPEAKLNDDEIKSICLTMVSAGLDTVPANIVQAIGYLSTPDGQLLQDRLHAAITEIYPENEAWDACLSEEKVPLISAFVKEVLRFYTVIPICLPRQNIEEITYNGWKIPAGTSFYMNAYAADYDSTHFEDPYRFNVDRYMKTDSSGQTEHYSYGAGSRMCAGSHLANREQYVAYVRLIAAFKIRPASLEQDRAIPDIMASNACTTALVSEVRDFKIQLSVRDEAVLHDWLEKSASDTAFMA